MKTMYLILVFTTHFLFGMGQNIEFYSATELAKGIREGKFTSYEVVSAYIEQIEQYNKSINAIVFLNKEDALDKAKRADEAIANGIIWGKLHGVPVTIKDNYKTKNLPTTAGYLPLKDYIPTEDAEIVKLLLDEGAIILGKTNLSVLAMDMQANNPLFGKTNNPWDTTGTSGGSSGGCAAALASGMTPLSFGNDLAGSIRLPAAYCGVYGFKPTYGITSMIGVQTDPKDKVNGIRAIAVAGPLARSIDDLVLALDIIAHESDNDRRIVPLSREVNPIKLNDLKIAWIDEFGNIDVDNEIREHIQKYVQKLSDAGAEVTKIHPDLDFYKVWNTWGSFVGMQGAYYRSNFARFIGTFFTKKVLKDVPMHQNIVKSISVEKYMEALEYQDSVINIMETFLNEYDVFVCPVSSVKAFKHHRPSKSYGTFNVYNEPLYVNGNPVHYYMATQAYTIPFALSESPVLTMPVALSEDGLPISIQIVGKRFYDFKLLKIAKELNNYINDFSFPLE